jgi:hypothetical protein
LNAAWNIMLTIVVRVGIRSIVIHKRPEKDIDNPPGQIVNHIPDAITEHNIRQWKKWEESRKTIFHPEIQDDPEKITCPLCCNKYYGKLPDDCEACGKRR